MIGVVGSGHSAMAAARALIRRGRSVLMLDAGLTPEAVALERKQELSALEPDQWPAGVVQECRASGRRARTGIPRKFYFGSDFVYRKPHDGLDLVQEHAAACQSFARGGFSNIWGAAALPCRAEELGDWPVSREDLAPHYRAVLADGGLAGGHDDLAEIFPLYGEEAQPLRSSRQAASFLAHLDGHRDDLRDAGVAFGRPRLMVRSTDQEGGGCRYCRGCLFGCPYDALAGGAGGLEALIAGGQLEYHGGILVERFHEHGTHVDIEARRLTDGTVFHYRVERVFLGTGVSPTARIMLASLDRVGAPLTVRNSDMFTIPFFRFRSEAAGDPGEPGHDLCQAFLELTGLRHSRRSVHLQFYGYNDLVTHTLRRMLGPLSNLAARPAEWILRRMFVAFGYLHSDHSSTLALALEPGSVERLRVCGQPVTASARLAREVHGRLRRLRKHLGGTPLPGLLFRDLPGGGYHSGGTFPMRDRPGQRETDIWGRPGGLERVHLVDSSVFPTVPATTFALTVMANAHRIAAGCEL